MRDRQRMAGIDPSSSSAMKPRLNDSALLSDGGRQSKTAKKYNYNYFLEETLRDPKNRDYFLDSASNYQKVVPAM